MERFQSKVKLILIPYIRINLITIIGYVTLSWLFFLGKPTLNLPPSLYLTTLPCILSAIVILFPIRKKIDLLGGSFNVEDPGSLFRMNKTKLVLLFFLWGILYGSLYWCQLGVQELAGDTINTFGNHDWLYQHPIVLFLGPITAGILVISLILFFTPLEKEHQVEK